MPQMMPIYWFFMCVLVNLFFHFFFGFYYHNFLVFSKFSSKMEKKGLKLNFLK